MRESERLFEQIKQQEILLQQRKEILKEAQIKFMDQLKKELEEKHGAIIGLIVKDRRGIIFKVTGFWGDLLRLYCRSPRHFFDMKTEELWLRGVKLKKTSETWYVNEMNIYAPWIKIAENEEEFINRKA